MIYLLMAVGLNLSGVFEIGGGLAGVGDGLTQGDSYRASFFTGVLTTLVATPCTAPFMAAAVGAALTQSPLVALIIFAALGAGLALPYLLLSLAPWMRRALPKPGAWMDTLEADIRVSDVCIGGVAIVGSRAADLLDRPRRRIGRRDSRRAGGLVLSEVQVEFDRRSRDCAASPPRPRCSSPSCCRSSLRTSLPPPNSRTPTVIAPGRCVAALRCRLGSPNSARTGQPLLVNFTASWCLTCLVNERNAFADAAVQRIFRDKGVTLMKGDWTNRDPAITAALASFGRAGVPLYVVYNSKPGSATPVVLPQLLTPGIVQDVFSDLPDRDSTK